MLCEEHLDCQVIGRKGARKLSLESGGLCAHPWLCVGQRDALDPTDTFLGQVDEGCFSLELQNLKGCVGPHRARPTASTASTPRAFAIGLKDGSTV